MYNKRTIGNEKEQKAAAYLTSIGYEVLAANFYTRFGEIDLIAKEQEVLVFIEVKYRKDLQSGSPFESVDGRKIKNICRAARYYMYSNGIPEDVPCRFDVIGIVNEEIILIRNAFDTQF